MAVGEVNFGAVGLDGFVWRDFIADWAEVVIVGMVNEGRGLRFEATAELLQCQVPVDPLSAAFAVVLPHVEGPALNVSQTA